MSQRNVSYGRKLEEGETLRVLVVDDEPDIAESVKFCLEQEGYDVRSACNGWEALGAVRTFAPHVVLLDVMLPHENGYRVSRLIKEDADRGAIGMTAVALVTARKLEDPEREQTFSEFSRADRVLYKPFDIDDLLTAVREMAGLEALAATR